MQLNVFDYQDYRKFLADFYAAKKEANPSFSHRVFSKQARLGSPSYLLMIMRGERNLSSKTLPRFSEALSLSSREREYFELLVHFNQTEDPELKARYFEELLTYKNKAPLKALEKARYEFLANWWMASIYVLVDTKGFKPDPRWIAKRLKNRISAADASEALRKLQALELIEPHPEKGFVQKSGALSVEDDTKSIAVFRYHSSMIQLALESLRADALTAREMNGVTVSIPKDQLPALKEKIRAFRKELNAFTSAFSDTDEVYQINIQMFALTDEKEK